MGKARENLPPEDGREWVQADVAAEMVGLSREYFVVVARENDFTRVRGRTRRDFCWYVRSEVESWAEFRRLRGRWYGRHRRSAKEARWTEKIDVELARRLFITTSEAAQLLGVVCSTVRGMVQRGRLLCYQSEPGRKGARLWFSRRAVLHLKEDEERQKRRAGYLQGRQHCAGHGRYGLMEARTVRGKIPEDWLTTREAAERLGVHPSRVRELRETGRLEGQRLWRRCKPLRFWYFPVWEVERLLADESYLAAREKWRSRKGKRMESTGTVLSSGQGMRLEELGTVDRPLFDETRGVIGPTWACDESGL